MDYDKMCAAVCGGLGGYLGVPVIRGNQNAQPPAYPFVSYNITTIAGANGGTYQQHPDGVDRKMVRSIWSLTALSDRWAESVVLATKAREWFEHTGRAWLSENGLTVQSTGEITNRDNILTVEYERKNGFDVVFYLFDQAEGLAGVNGFIESAEIARESF